MPKACSPLGGDDGDGPDLGQRARLAARQDRRAAGLRRGELEALPLGLRRLERPHEDDRGRPGRRRRRGPRRAPRARRRRRRRLRLGAPEPVPRLGPGPPRAAARRRREGHRRAQGRARRGGHGGHVDLLHAALQRVLPDDGLDLRPEQHHDRRRGHRHLRLRRGELGVRRRRRRLRPPHDVRPRRDDGLRGRHGILLRPGPLRRRRPVARRLRHPAREDRHGLRARAPGLHGRLGRPRPRQGHDRRAPRGWHRRRHVLGRSPAFQHFVFFPRSKPSRRRP